MRSPTRNPSCRYQPGETAPSSRSESGGQVEREGYLLGLRTWQESCPCCFSSIHPEGVPTGPPMPLEDDDVAYVRREFVPLGAVCAREGIPLAKVRDMVHTGQSPKPPYVLPDGTEMVPDDYFELIHDAGNVERLREHFVERFESAARRHGDPATRRDTRQAWVEYLSGEYFVCLKRATPENIEQKGWLVPRIEHLMREPRANDPDWRNELNSMVEELDALERPFAAYDRIRFGSANSRERLITTARRSYL
jgi:hypothetical protein